MNTNFLDSCLSYSTCGIVLHMQDINWMTVGAVVYASPATALPACIIYSDAVVIERV